MNTQMLLNVIKNMVDLDVQVDVQTVNKGNKILTGISIGKGNVRPVVYVENYQDLFEEKGYIEVASEMIKACKEATEKHNFNTYDIEKMTSWDYAKEHLLLCIAPVGTNDGYMTIPYLDLELYFRVEVVEDGNYKVKEEMLNAWNVTKEDILNAALETNTYVSYSMLDMLIDMLKEEDAPYEMIEQMKQDSKSNYQTVLTNKDKTLGASAIYKTEILKEIADKYENDLYIIPSSIHELIVIPKEGMSIAEMNAMIRETNETQVKLEEVLSDHVYIFNRETMKIEW